jgi:hypothetical protein
VRRWLRGVSGFPNVGDVDAMAQNAIKILKTTTLCEFKEMH